MKAFTLIETFVSILIITIISAFLIFFVISLSSYSQFFIFSMGSQREVDFALNKMAKEMRTMNYSSNGAYPIEFATSNSIIFYSDVDNDGITERIRYFVENNILKRGLTKAFGTPPVYDLSKEKILNLVYNIESFQISYYDETFNLLIPPIENYKIKIIKVEIKTKPLFNKPSIGSYIIVSPRNLKTK